MIRALSRHIRCLALAAVCLHPASGLDPARVESQYAHDTWGGGKGLTGEVHAITQTRDGYLWIAADSGLYRFDGLNFRLMTDRSPSPVSIINVMGLTVNSEGDLMVRLPERNLLRYADGKFENALYPLVPRELAVTAMCRGSDGSLYLVGLIHGILRYANGRFETVAPVTALPGSPIISMTQSAGGRLWLGTREAGLFYWDGKTVAAVKGELPGRKIEALLADGANVWIGTDAGLARWNGTGISNGEAPASLRNSHVLSLLADRQSNLWVGTTSGLFRVNGSVSPLDNPERGSAAAVNALFEDREGTLWVGGKWGLERWRDGSFMTYGKPEGLPSDHNGPIDAAPDGRTWFAPLEGGLYWLSGGQTTRVTEAGLAGDVVYSIAGNSGDLWVGRQRGGLTHLYSQGGDLKAKTFTQADGLAQNSVFSVYRSRDGAIWAGTLNRGVSRYRDGRFTTYSAATGLASNTVSSILETSDGTMWFGTPDGLRAFAANHWRGYTAKEGLPSDEVNCLLQDSSGILWIGTAAGLSFLGSGGVRTPQDARRAVHEPVFGMAQSQDGWLWIATSDHIVRINRDKLLRGGITEGDSFNYIPADGLRSARGVRRDRSVMADSQGRIWFSMATGLSVVNPAQLTNGSAPAFVHVEGVSADDSALDPHRPVQIPPGTRRITFAYSGGSLGDPSRVRFRYQLAGYDPNWSAPTTAREASYTNVGPGTYHFRVSALNSSGRWNDTGAVLDFAVAPRYYQTTWFRLTSVAVVLGLLGALYRLRLAQVSRQFNIRMEERVHERMRIARELHDTLLQSFNGVVLKFSAVSYMIRNRPEDAESILKGLVEEARLAIVEGRDAVQGLRSSTVLTNDLARAITTFGEGLVSQHEGRQAPDFRVHVEGESADLVPLVRDEIYRIAGESLRNAFRHAEARRIEVTIQYGKRQLRLSVNDDGKGIEAQILRAGGRDGHHGLPGMRERAELVGGRLAVRSEPNAGAEIELTVPAAIAYAKSATAG